MSYQGFESNTSSYVTEFLKLATELKVPEEAAKPGLLHNVGTGFQELGDLNPGAKGALGGHIRGEWAKNIANQAGELGNTTLSIGQKLKPAWETAKSTVSKFKNPLMAAGVLGAAAIPATALATKGVQSATSHPQGPYYR